MLRNPWPLAGASLGLGLLLGLSIGQIGIVPVNPQLPALDANLWQHTSAEYRACCLQAYAPRGAARRGVTSDEMDGAVIFTP